MNEYIKYEVWENYWCFKPVNSLEFSHFLKLDYSSWSKIDEIQIRMESNKNNIIPESKQVKTLDFINENQPKIISSIFDYYQKVILPVYKVATDIEDEEVATNESELSRVLGIRGIEIPEINNYQSNYFLIEFDFGYDPEHGLNILLDNLTPIDFFGDGEKNYDVIDFYQNGLKNNNGEPIKVNLYELNGDTIFQKYYQYDELINFDLKKGTYRAFVTWNGMEICRNFHVPKNLTQFTLREIFTY
ncbi:hypothetical protein ABW636_18995 [Aquimarina sp. 2201CG1-2-11]|uniref:DUF6985 domain-containing protein n=1 Tax=Aquimarina discodermiae TaxID=3231043 RepID=UPI0034628670